MIATGEYRFGADTGRMLLRTYRTGLGSRAGHDLTIEATSWQGRARVGVDLTGSSVTVSVDVDSFEVREGRGGVKALTDADRADIRNTINQKILGTARWPAVTFRSTALRGVPDDLSVDGELTIRDATGPITVRGAVEESVGGPRMRATAQVVQSQWGIKPYTAFFGALKLRDAVDIDIDAALAPS